MCVRVCPGVVCVGVFFVVVVVVVVAVGVLLERIWTKDLHPGHIMRVGVSSLCFLVFGFCVFSFFFAFVVVVAAPVVFCACPD